MARQLYIPGVFGGVAFEEDGSDAIYVPKVGVFGEELASGSAPLIRDCAFVLSLQGSNDIDLVQRVSNTAERISANLNELTWLNTLAAQSSSSIHALSGGLSPNKLVAEWRSEFSALSKGLLEFSISWSSEHFAELEWLSSWSDGVDLPVTWSRVHQSKQTLTCSWSGALEVQRDQNLHIDWRGSNDLSTSIKLPITWNNTSTIAISLPFDFLANRHHSTELGISNSIALRAILFGHPAWRAGTRIDCGLPVSWQSKAIFSSYQVHPIEWGGVGGFVTGNIRLFTDDPRDGVLADTDRATSFRSRVRGINL